MQLNNLIYFYNKIRYLLIYITLFITFSQVSAQEKSSEKLYITKQSFTVKSKNTYYDHGHFYCELIHKNKYIKIPIKGKLVDKNLLVEKLSVIILDSNTIPKRMHTLSLGNKDLGNKKIKNKNK